MRVSVRRRILELLDDNLKGQSVKALAN